MKTFQSSDQALLLLMAYESADNRFEKNMNKYFRITGRGMKHWYEINQS